jgi:hypothetical protein
MAGKGTSSTLGELLARPPVQRGPRCTIGNILASLTTGDRETLIKAIDDPLMSIATVARALTDYLDRRVSADAVSRHRRRGDSGGCVCSR